MTSDEGRLGSRSTNGIRYLIGLLARAYCGATFVFIVGHAVYHLWERDEKPLAVVAGVLSPFTSILWPIFGDPSDYRGIPLWALLVGIVLAYPVSTFVGRLPPLDRPRDLLSPATWIPIASHTTEFERAQQRVDRLLFEAAAERYFEQAARPNPVNSSVETAVRIAVAWLGEDIPEGDRLGLSTIAVRGYLWRSAEQGPTSLVDDQIRERIRASLSEGEDRSRYEPAEVTLYHAASRCLADEVPVWQGCLGGIYGGVDTYLAALRLASEDFEEVGWEVSDNDQQLGFRFGICLHDVERLLPDVLQDGDPRPSHWAAGPQSAAMEAGGPTDDPGIVASGSVGETLAVTNDDGARVAVTLLEVIDPWQAGSPASEGHRLIRAKLLLTNTSQILFDDSLDLGLEVVDRQQRSYEALSAAELAKPQLSDVRLKPGESASGHLTFELPERAAVDVVVYVPDCGTALQGVSWRLSPEPRAR